MTNNNTDGRQELTDLLVSALESHIADLTGPEFTALIGRLHDAGPNTGHHTPATPAPPADPATAGDYPAHWLTTGATADYPPDTHSRRMSTEPRKDR